ncbi:GNAT family N-acetyltransferase [Sedimentibacter sp.]|uniref:GNAT family N-acetyltransferase n=1 Tax=Sedimentibacter sp. TaxID=1960295 RepID=UPI0028A1C3EB|nr:GNAT family N-acetyltransferase [Sedimentibacter sp.]
MKFIDINEDNREQVNNFLMEYWYSTDMVLRGAIVDMTKISGIIVYDDKDKIIGLLTYIITDGVCELISLDSIEEGKGIGTLLIEQLIQIAKVHNCRKIILITTNDNVSAIRFYQKKGFDMIRVYFNALETSRKLKPAIPLVGDNEIPLKHEIEFELKIT